MKTKTSTLQFTPELATELDAALRAIDAHAANIQVIVDADSDAYREAARVRGQTLEIGLILQAAQEGGVR